ncbi:MAG: alkaline phosphatase family protein [Nitrospiraceae bacterium]|nr:alkaline phosphatase family protein [Nitrospiraceae bacterium]
MSTDKKTASKILIIGIDGATFSLIAPWAEEGKLPHLRHLMQNGAWGNLDSTIPPLTSPAWTSFMTGKNPGKHGLFHFISPKPGTYGFDYTNANTRRSRTIWSILSGHGKTVGVVNVPMTFPPEKVNGFMISGMDTPDENSDFIYPGSLRDELQRDFGGVRLEIRHLEFMRSDDKRDAVLREMATLEDHRAKLAVHLLGRHPVDVFMLVFCSVDQIQHYFWHYMDKNHFRHDGNGSSKFKDAILHAYQTIDTKLGEMLEAVPEDTTIVLMSDHGAGPSSPTIVHLNRYMADIGVLKFKETSPRSFLHLAVKTFDPLLRRTLTPRQKAKIANFFPGVRKKWETSLTSLSAIDWESTKAFCYEVLPTYTNVYVNLKGKFPHGTVNPGAEYEELLGFITDRLHGLKDPETGTKVVKGIFRKHEVYTGPYAESAPDLLLSWWDDDSFTLRPSPQESDGTVVKKLSAGADNFVNWSGTHRYKGIFLFKGRPFRHAHVPDGTGIADLAPTLLYLMGCPIPEDMDGKVIESAFSGEYLRDHPINYAPPSDPVQDGPGEGSYSDEEADMIKKRLKALGYLE